MTKAWADNGGYHTKVIDHGARLGIDVEVAQRDPDVKGFKVIPRLWDIERTFGRLTTTTTTTASPAATKPTSTAAKP